jgi:hypothetical protein
MNYVSAVNVIQQEQGSKRRFLLWPRIISMSSERPVNLFRKMQKVGAGKTAYKTPNYFPGGMSQVGNKTSNLTD